ncbi:hypothetical protein M409DRAFT_56618 [Zasmidium cellare ATCC 36951]|uniref:Uncharacterized protein n=1 Tax=Zasmidium cellare ATCC 36951 TaxID=1080233 RepID=A0A6A6CEI7_ZASCE|nr:uncharacterized protein M409DRAFT_56618 [Zasmidium cellare ATCC 36951]KAF2164342.1 hypothetical protein M409DRAFT_56618 [Zasmidium cellare ATCC 36951]
MKLSLLALAIAPVVALVTAHVPYYNITPTFFDLQITIEPINDTSTTFTPQMEIDLYGALRATDRPASPHGDWDEDLFVQLVEEIYHTLARLVPVEEGDVTYPPPPPKAGGGEGHPLDLTNATDTDPVLASLLKRLPVDRRQRREIISGMGPVDFLGEKGVYFNRLLDEMNEIFRLGPRERILGPPTAFRWLKDSDNGRPVVVVDVGTNSIHRMRDAEILDDAYTKQLEGNEAKLEDCQCDYRNWPSMAAPEFLMGILRKFHEGVWIPDGGGYVEIPAREMEEEWVGRMSAKRRLLMDVYGWPGEGFRESDWKREVQRYANVRPGEDEDFCMKLLP